MLHVAMLSPLAAFTLLAAAVIRQRLSRAYAMSAFAATICHNLLILMHDIAAATRHTPYAIDRLLFIYAIRHVNIYEYHTRRHAY